MKVMVLELRNAAGALAATNTTECKKRLGMKGSRSTIVPVLFIFCQCLCRIHLRHALVFMYIRTAQVMSYGVCAFCRGSIIF